MINNKISRSSWVISLLALMFTVTYVHTSLKLNPAYTFLGTSFSFLGIWYVNDTMFKICRSFYLDLGTYFSYQKKFKRYKILFVSFLLLSLLTLCFFQETKSTFFLVLFLMVLPILLCGGVFFYLYHKQIKDNLHILIIQEASSLCKKFTWSSASSKIGNKKVIALTCYFPQYKIHLIHRFLKGKLESHGYTLTSDYSGDSYTCTVHSESGPTRVLSLRTTDTEYLYEIDIITS